MKLFFALLLAVLAGLVQAHTSVFAIFVDGVDQGLGNIPGGYIRSPPNNDPITDVGSNAMTCNANNSPAARTIDVWAGQVITFEWHRNAREDWDDILDPSHRGPVMTYIAPTYAYGNVWVKLAEEGFDGVKWATDKLIENRGKHSIKVPDLVAGEYLLRPEIIALHEGHKMYGAQFYMECVQIRVKSNGWRLLPAGAAFPGTYYPEHEGIFFDPYKPFTHYKIPGPPVWEGSWGTGMSGDTALDPVTSAAPIAATTSLAAPSTLVTVAKPAPSSAAGTGTGTGGKVEKYGQCGGRNHVGSTTCADGSTCQVQDEWYSQCL
ncbi:hypothetical protein H2199_003378 [Coniosporium tulheliwenetii]|uniref:Uncharacterized protein n=1 Tax=Coniosporium tulheliwenetii TaxID=3383036 RepID=A0ACC2ZDI5_9PEZI|nr:hypothetical protein H2199_003378 [Cladosporium sp. JES 115]